MLLNTSHGPVKSITVASFVIRNPARTGRPAGGVKRRERRIVLAPARTVEDAKMAVAPNFNKSLRFMPYYSSGAHQNSSKH